MVENMLINIGMKRLFQYNMLCGIIIINTCFFFINLSGKKYKCNKNFYVITHKIQVIDTSNTLRLLMITHSP